MGKQYKSLNFTNTEDFESLMGFLEHLKSQYTDVSKSGVIRDVDKPHGAETVIADIIENLKQNRKVTPIEQPNIYVIEHYRKEDNPMVGTTHKLTHIAYEGYMTDKENAELTVKMLNQGVDTNTEYYSLRVLRNIK